MIKMLRWKCNGSKDSKWCEQVRLEKKCECLMDERYVPEGCLLFPHALKPQWERVGE